MTRRRESQTSRRLSSFAIVTMTNAVGLIGPGAEIHAEEHDTSPASTELERAFWLCDHTVSRGRVDVGTAVACASISDELKATKFSGDFNALLAWWRLNKEAEYRALDTAGNPARPSDASGPPDRRQP